MASDSSEKWQKSSPSLESNDTQSNVIISSETEHTDNILISHSSTSTDANNTHQDKQQFGWLKLHPRIFQRFLSAKWALFWLCWAGALQGNIISSFIHCVCLNDDCSSLQWKSSDILHGEGHV